MRRRKALIFTLIALLSLFSLRDKEVVLHVPDITRMVQNEAEAGDYPESGDPSSGGSKQGVDVGMPGGVGASSGSGDTYYPPVSPVSGGGPAYQPPVASSGPSDPGLSESGGSSGESGDTSEPSSEGGPIYGLGGGIIPVGGDPEGGGGGNGPNNAPEILSFTPTDTTPSVDEGGLLHFEISATDQDGNALNYTWQFDGSAIANSANNWTYSPDHSSSGTHTVTVIVSDGSLTDQQTWTVTVLDVETSNSVFITELIPDNAITGNYIYIQGAGFSSDPTENIVTFDTEVSNTVHVVAENRIRASVPQNLSPGFKDLFITVGSEVTHRKTFDVLEDSRSHVFTDRTGSLLPSNIDIQDSALLKAGDIDRDRDMDLLIVDAVSSRLFLLVNGGDGNFTDQGSALLPTLPGPDSVIDIIFADIDNDADQDILLLYSQGQSLRLLLNDGSGLFTDVTSTRIPGLSGESSSVDSGDVDGDGDLDLIMASTGAQDTLLINDGAGGFTQDTNFNLPAITDASSDIVFCDVDGDGDLDIITANNGMPGLSSLRNRLYKNDGTGSFTDATEAALPEDYEYSETIECGDIDNDLDLDMVVANYYNNAVLINDGNGIFEDRSDERIPRNQFSANDVALGDVDGDGDLDMLALGDSNISLFINDGFGTFEDGSIKFPDYMSVPAELGGKSLELVDIDGDGDMDIVLGGSDIYILVNEESNKAPILSSIGNRTVAIGEELAFNVTARDPNGDALTYSAKLLPDNSLPAGAVFDASGQLFSWTPSAGQEGTYNVRFEVTDGEFTVHEDIIITAGGNNPPILTVDPPESVLLFEAGDSWVFLATATDPEGDLPITFSWIVNGEEIGNAVGETSLLSLIFGSGTHEVVVTATDSRGASSSFTWTVHVNGTGQQNHAPIIDLTAPAVSEVPTIFVQPGGFMAQSFAVTEYHDPDGDDIRFAWYKKVAGGTYEVIPNASNANLALALTEGEYFIKVRLTDDGSPNLSTSFEWHVTIVELSQGNRAPVIDATDPSLANLPTIFIQPGQTAQQSFAVTQYHDPDVGDTINFGWHKRVAGGTYEEIPNAIGQSVGLGLTAGEYFIRVTLTDDGSPNLSTSFEWHVTIVEVTQGNHAPVIDIANPANAEIPTIFIQQGGTGQQSFAVTQYHDPDVGDTISFSWQRKTAGGTYTDIPALAGQMTAALDFTEGEYYVKVMLTDDGTPNMSTSYEWHVTVEVDGQAGLLDQIIEGGFGFFWNETDNPSTGFTRDRIAVNPDNRNSGYDTRYERASIAATGFSLASLPIAAERFGDPGWDTPPADLLGRAEMIIDKLLEIQGNQDPAGDGTWGKDGFFYHFVDINTGERWPGSEVSTIDTALLIAGVLTAGEYFKDIDTEPVGHPDNIREKALRVYKNVNWKAFLDETETVPNTFVAASPFHNQMYHAWDPDRSPGDRLFGHWDYTSEALILYLLAIATPEASYAIPEEAFYSFRRELGKYGEAGKPLIQSWFGSLFVNQYTQAFFDFKDGAGNPLFDMQGADWWQNSVEATIANKQFANDHLADYAGETNLWGLTAGYTSGFDYAAFGAPPAGVAIPSAEVRGADGTVFPAGPGGSIPFLPGDTIDALTVMRDLYDAHGHPVWGDYGFVDSFRMGDTITDTLFPIADFYVGIDIGITIVMAENYLSGLIWENFANFEIKPGTTIKNSFIESAGLTADSICRIEIDDISPDSNFHMGVIDQESTAYEIQFDLQNVIDGSYLLAIHSFMDEDLGNHAVGVNVSVNGAPISINPVLFTFDSSGNEAHLMKYIPVDSALLQNGQNSITLEWLAGSSSWLAWKNVEISSPVASDIWAVSRDESADPMILFGNEYRVDDTYYVGANVSSFEQAVNKDVQNFTDLLFYAENTEYAKLTLGALKTDRNAPSNLQVFINGVTQPAFDGLLSTGSVIETDGFYLVSGWNRITLYHPGVGNGGSAEWIRWESLSLAEAVPPLDEPPSEFSGASFGKSEIRLRWQRAPGASEYNIYRSSSGSGPFALIATVDDPDATYNDDNEGAGLDDQTTYHYLVRGSDGTLETQDSEHMAVTTGPYELDFGDGHDPNVFGGITMDNAGTPLGDNAYAELEKFDGSTGSVRQAILSSGQKNTIALGSMDISDATIFSIRVRSDIGGENFRIKLKDAVGVEASISLQSSSADTWQEMHLNIADTFAGVDLTNMESLIIVSETVGQEITVYLDEVEFSTVELTGFYIDVKVKNGTNDSIATGLNFGNVTPVNPKVLSDQYLEIDYVIQTPWGIQIYTDNLAADANPRFTGTGDRVNGLIGVSNSGYRLPLIWQVWQVKKGYYNGSETPEFDTTINDGDQAEFAFTMDKGDSDWADGGFVRNFRTMFNSNAELGAPVPLAPGGGYWPRVGTVGDPLYVYLGADFTGVPPQVYTTNKLTVEVYTD
ncbi:MAG: FG-GAP-like repeat-containing protein [Candidatus Omnitrophota bacterium]